MATATLDAPISSVPRAATVPSAKLAAKACARGIAFLAVLPFLISYRLGCLVLGPNRALEGASQTLSLFPGLAGNILRNAFLSRVLAACDSTADVSFGTIFSQAGAKLGRNVYVGPRCCLGLVTLEDNVLLGAGVHVPSGGKTHAFSDPTLPIQDQGGTRTRVTIGAGAWVGSGAIVLADVGPGTVVAAGSVVTKPLPANAVAAGVPARVLRSRFDPPKTDFTIDEGASA